ncbi:DNA helicase RecD [Streptomyces sp. NA04227]|uniref:helix-hairpin-helix domain-containing protein n=1 Tax=Streptomyces sp. NA04227 TaxID=2742136 RepID=UPI001591A6CC|nr:helix-hairpin-helix domain-containing protein [Streptomyces sp. NA04227]QKW05655.1 DNA helicase RecD [Streptomyces sp. NA04227]
MNAEPALARNSDSGAAGGSAGAGGSNGLEEGGGTAGVGDGGTADTAGAAGAAGAELEGGGGAGAEDSATSAGAEDSAEDEAGADADAGADVDAGADAGGDAEDGSEAGGGDSDGDGKSAELSEAEAELAAQRELRARIEQRKADKQGPVDAGTKLSGKAADLLAAVRAVESGERPAASVFAEPEAPRRPVTPEPSQPRPAAAPTVPTGPSAELVEAVGAVLAEGGAPGSLALPAAQALGQGADEQLRADPWQLLRVGTVRPEQADGFARALLGPECSPADERRGRALTVRLLEQAAAAGHTALEAPTLARALGRYSVPEPEEAVQSAIAEGEILVFQDALDDAPGPVDAKRSEDAEDTEDERPVRVLLGLERYALAEESLADGIARLIGTPLDESTARWEGTAEGLRGAAAELSRAVAEHALALHTGGEASRAEPAAVVSRALRAGLRVCVAAHTPYGAGHFGSLLGADKDSAAAGDAASGATDGAEGEVVDPGGEAVAAKAPRQPQPHDARPWITTVAALLGGHGGPARSAEGTFELDLLVVLDAPQLDVETAASLVEALPDGARLVLSGDPAVLWSAGPGRVFADLLAARRCPQIASRTPDPGPLGELVSGIGAGELLQVAAPGKEIVIVPVRDPGEAVHRTVQLVADSVPRTFGVAPGETQVITPGHGGAAGAGALNAALKERLNPGPGRFGGFDPGDRVVHTPAPGRAVPGVVVRADAAGLHLDCEGGAVAVPKEQVPEVVSHGWAVTAQQAAGRRWPTAVVVLPGDTGAALTRSWVYTAFGRGERHLSVVHGVDHALPEAVADRPAKPRTTRLTTLLRTPAAGEAPAQG